MDEMGCSYSTNQRFKSFNRRIPERKRILGTSGVLKWIFKKQGVDGIHLSLDTVQWGALMNKVMNLRIA
jgi:hypothetical protein